MTLPSTTDGALISEIIDIATRAFGPIVEVIQLYVLELDQFRLQVDLEVVFLWVDSRSVGAQWRLGLQGCTAFFLVLELDLLLFLFHFELVLLGLLVELG